MTNLLPCPFCGGEAEIVDVCNDCLISGKVGIGCSKCPVIIAEYGEYKVFDSEAEAIEAWNTRAKQPTVTVVSEFQPRSEYICQVIDLVAELAQEQDGAVLCHPQEPVVRCKDCLHATELLDGTYDCSGYLAETWDYYNDEPKQNIVPPDGFCSWGEPREGSDK